MASYLWNSLFLTEVLEQPGSGTCVDNVVALLEWPYVYTDVDATPQRVVV